MIYNDIKFLLHCYAGKSRSVAIAIAFMVEVLGMTFDSGLELIKEKRYYLCNKYFP